MKALWSLLDVPGTCDGHRDAGIVDVDEESGSVR